MWQSGGYFSHRLWVPASSAAPLLCALMSTWCGMSFPTPMVLLSPLCFTAVEFQLQSVQNVLGNGLKTPDGPIKEKKSQNSNIMAVRNTSGVY